MTLAVTRKLLEQFQAGDARAAGRLLQRHRAFLVRMVDLRMDDRLRRRVDPSDVVQEAQLEATRRFPERPAVLDRRLPERGGDEGLRAVER